MIVTELFQVENSLLRHKKHNYLVQLILTLYDSQFRYRFGSHTLINLFIRFSTVAEVMYFIETMGFFPKLPAT